MASAPLSYLSLRTLLLASLALWRLTHLFWGEDGPWQIFVHLRRLAGNSILGQILDCFYCLSLWLSLPLAFWLGSSWLDRILLAFALSGAAILLERVTDRIPERIPPAPTPITAPDGPQEDLQPPPQ